MDKVVATAEEALAGVVDGASLAVGRLASAASPTC